MENKKNQELKVEKVGKEKKNSDWNVKKVLTTIIIVVLALLMIGGLYYIVILFQQGTDESNVFGKYNGEPIKYEAGSVFYNALNSNSAYRDAAQSGNIEGMYSAWYQAYQSQVTFTALNQMAEAAKIRRPSVLVDKLLVNSGIYASEDGSKTFDEEVYNATSPVDRTATYQYYTKIYPYFVVLGDIQNVKVSDAERDFVAEASKNTRSFDYYVVDFNAYPDSLALEYDTSKMELEEGKTPSVEEIKAFIFSQEPDTVKPYIEEAIANAVLEGFDVAAEVYGKGLNNVENAVCNIGGSTFMYNDVNGMDAKGYLAAAMTQDLANELFNAEVGYITAPVAVNDAYIVVRVTSKEPTEGAASYISAMYKYYAPTIAVNDLVSTIMSSDKHENNFMDKFFPLLFGGMTI